MPCVTFIKNWGKNNGKFHFVFVRGINGYKLIYSQLETSGMIKWNDNADGRKLPFTTLCAHLSPTYHLNVPFYISRTCARVCVFTQKKGLKRIMNNCHHSVLLLVLYYFFLRLKEKFKIWAIGTNILCYTRYSPDILFHHLRIIIMLSTRVCCVTPGWKYWRYSSW